MPNAAENQSNRWNTNHTFLCIFEPFTYSQPRFKDAHGFCWKKASLKRGLVYTPVFILSGGPLGPGKKVVLEAGSFLTTSVLKAGLTVPGNCF